MKTCLDLCRTIAMCAVLSGAAIQAPAAAPLGLPPVPIPAAQPKLPPKIALGDRLFHDERFSSDGKVSCLTCHEEDKAVADHRQVSSRHEGLLGAPAVSDAAYVETLF